MWGGVGCCYFHDRGLEVRMKMQVVAFPVLNESVVVLAYCVFGLSVLKYLKVKNVTVVT